MSSDRTVTITLTDGGGPTDADGILSGNGLSKTGVGTYVIAATYPYSLASYLQNLVFTPTAVASGTRTTNFELNVSDPTAGVSTDDKNTSVDVIGGPGKPPLISGGPAPDQKVAPGNAISPFSSVTISDTNANPSDSATLTLSGGGTLSGAGLTPVAVGTYVVAATSPSALTAIIDEASFTPPALDGQSSETTLIDLAVTNNVGSTNASTKVTEQQPPPPPVVGFTVADQTTGQQTVVAGDPYSGPVTGIAKQLILRGGFHNHPGLSWSEYLPSDADAHFWLFGVGRIGFQDVGPDRDGDLLLREAT